MKLETLLKRLSEGSTWAGVAVLLTLTGVNIPGEMIPHLVQIAGGLSGLVAIAKADKGNK